MSTLRLAPDDVTAVSFVRAAVTAASCLNYLNWVATGAVLSSACGLTTEYWLHC